MGTKYNVVLKSLNPTKKVNMLLLNYNENTNNTKRTKECVEMKKPRKMKWIQMFVFGHFQSNYVVTSQQLNAVGQPVVCAI